MIGAIEDFMNESGKRTWVKNGLNKIDKIVKIYSSAYIYIYICIYEWNKLPLFIKKSINLSTFKSSLKTYLFKLFFWHPKLFILFYLDIYIILLLNIYA